MPCDSIRSTDIQLGKETDTDAMLEGLKQLKLNPSRYDDVIRFSGGQYDTRNHTLTFRAGQSYAEQQAAKIKDAYMIEAARGQAKRMGFQIRDGKARDKFQLVRRTI